MKSPWPCTHSAAIHWTKLRRGETESGEKGLGRGGCGARPARVAYPFASPSAIVSLIPANDVARKIAE